MTPGAPPLRVALVAGLASGGTARHVGWLARGCRDAGLAVSLLAPAATIAALGAAPPGPPDGLAVTPLPAGDRLNPARDLSALAVLRGRLARWQPDVVHAHGVRAGALAAAAIVLLPRRARPPLAVTVHNAPPPGRAAAAVHAALELACARRAGLIWGASADLTARLRARGAASAEQLDVPAGPPEPASAAAAAAVRAEFGAQHRPLVVAAGRLAAQKGFDVLIGAAARWRDRDPQPVTVIAGDGPDARQLAGLAARAGGDVRLPGHRGDIAALLAAADVVVVPSRWEARAFIVQEAMAAGRPVVATLAGGTAGLTGEDGALLVPREDPAALAAAVTAVLDDPALAARLGEGAKARASAFPTEGETLGRILGAYAGLAAGEAQPARQRR